jgi:hypothetical protein
MSVFGCQGQKKDAQGLFTLSLKPVTWWVRSHGKIGYVMLDVSLFTCPI